MHSKHPTRPLRFPATVIAVTGLLLSACSGGTGHQAAATASATPPSGPAAAAAPAPSDTASPAATATLAPLPAATPADLEPYYKQKLAWRSCGVPEFECAAMKVPLDYAHPVAADDLKLAVARKKAAGPGKRLGSLLVNPGGPGGSAIDYLQYAASGYPAAVTARYDMAAVDPRGVARSEPVKCLTDKQMDAYTAVDSTPDDTAETDKLAAADRTFAAGCKKMSAGLIGHVSTVDSARDMDVMRQLLGDAKLNYVGKSYGTFLGATYAGLFPQRVGRLVLDGAMDPSVNALESSRAQAGGFEIAFNAFARDCVKRSDCPLGRTSAADAGTRLDALFARLDKHPLPTGTERPLSEALGTTGVIAAMYDQEAWPALRGALISANKGDGAPLLQLSDSYYERDDAGKYSNLMYANAAVNCLDLPAAFHSPADVKKAVPSFRAASPHFGTALAWSSLICGYWPLAATGHPERIQAKGAAPILVVGTIRDPATPYAWAKSLAAQLSSGHLLTYDGDGHTAYARGSTCIDTAVNAYLLSGTVPPSGKKCT
ncbi:alpha/beta hydrolase [Streptomyces cocklensis]|jgi:pimeloyl-ACP methyl ester carboxylesterase|uniref:Tripeptidyl-peptidase B. Serine peptidase. MEROPS family S33 n=1 Tax=Actinacidiphila cocklensis TaxID=887465 RepID=A0A9W4EBC0_9ACTN|nr:alpha/beta hydrolase [Actinacidiphila cocklensis]MDD1057809.1 alpha/beta hydrolase [Actinacidiphila cocklensis]CAG6398536.1 Tripeptidyl-peptidase B. Serine peptidase. MEROPS family S33 [Actinacidiphila cocklensis]